MAATSLPRLAGESAPGIRLAAALRVAVLTAALAGAPCFAPGVVAQHAASIRASADVTRSLIGARLVADGPAASRAVSLPVVRQVRIAELGTVGVEAGPREEIAVARRLERVQGRSTMLVLVACVGS
ncbi:MAG TPA: hypothetical protein VMF70_02540 [Gemmatimonadales bacterium]|nr:hypothetical protein [Gemmatimonadales bacterium]